MSGSNDFDLSFESDRTAELSVVGLELEMDPSDLAFTSLSLAAAVFVGVVVLLVVLLVVLAFEGCRL